MKKYYIIFNTHVEKGIFKNRKESINYAKNAHFDSLPLAVIPQKTYEKYKVKK